MSDKQVQGAEEQAPVIDLAGNRKWGYKVSEVDDFLARAHDLYEREEPALTQEEIQLQSFDLEKNGYVIGQVDATLVRLERAVADKQTQWDLLHEGRGAWQRKTSDLAETLRARAEREPRDRFKAGLKKTPSYDKKQVDALVDQAWAHISENLGLSPAATEKPKGADDVDTAKVANVIFTQRKGPRGYDEASVDAYLNRVIQVLTRVESIERVMQGEDEVIADQAPVMVPSGAVDAGSDFFAAAGASGEVAEAIPVSEQASSLASLVSAEPRETVPLSDAEKTSVDNDALPPSFAPQSHPETSPDGLMSDAQVPGTASPADEAPRPETEVEEAQSSPLPTPAVRVPAASPAPVSADASQSSVTSTASPASAAVPSVGEVPLPAGGFAAGTSQLQQEESAVNADSESSQVPDAPEPSSAQPSQTQPDENPDEYLSSLLSSTSVQTSSFEIPNLTFPTVPGASASSPAEESGADSEEKSKDSEESTNG